MLQKIKDYCVKCWNKEVAIHLAIIAAVVAITMLAAYKVNGIYPFGDSSIARGDMVQQTIPAGVYYVWDIFHGDASPFFAWNTAFGMNISGASSLGALLSPLNLLLLFVPRAGLAYFVNILLILKMIAVGFAMYFYLRKYDVPGGVHIIGGILYAFGAAALVHFQIILVLESAFLLPLLMIGIDRIIHNKGCKFFIFMLALSMAVNVYTGGIMLIFIFLSTGLRIFWGAEEEEGKEKRRCAMQLGVSVLAGLLLSAVVTIPALLCISKASRTATGDLLSTYLTAINHSWSQGEWATVERMIVNIALPAACILFFLFRGNGTLSERMSKYRCQICMVFLMLLSVLVSGTELLWHGGSRAMWPVRFVFVITFVIIDFAVRIYQDHKKEEDAAPDRKKDIILLCVSAVMALVSSGIFYGIYDAYSKHEVYSQLGDGFLCILTELLFAGFYLFLLRLENKKIIFAVLCAELTCMSVMSYAPNKENSQIWSYEHLLAGSSVAESMKTELEDFERIKNIDYSVDLMEYSLVMGTEAISNYWHVISPSLQPDFAALGYSINWTQMLDTGGTIFTDTLFQMKYNLSQEGLPEALYEHCEDLEKDETDVVGLYKNRFELPFAINTDVPSLEAQGEKFATQNSLFQAVTGNSTPLITDITGQINGNTVNLAVGNERKVLYFYGTNTSSNPVSITVNGEPVYFASSAMTGYDKYPADFCNGIVCLGSFQNQNVSIQFTGSDDVSGLHLGSLDYNTFAGALEQIKKTNPKIVSLKQKNAGLRLELENVTKENILLPVSYDEGWVCKVNGKKVSKINTIDGMLSIPVSNGKNTIELKFVAPGRHAGMALSALVIILLAAVTVLRKKGIIDIGQVKAADYAGYAAYVVYAMLFVAVIAIMFVIPAMYYLKRIFIPE